MFLFQAPYPALQTTTVLPSPQFSDSESLPDTFNQQKAMDGTRYIYVHRKQGRRKAQWTFLLTRNKALELRAFILAYYASQVRAVDHDDNVWVGNFINNPFEMDTPERGGPAISPMPKGEAQTIQIEFEGLKNA
jgi:hypothetical protein